MIESGVSNPGAADREVFEGFQVGELRQSLVVNVGLPEIEPLQFSKLGKVSQTGAAHRRAFERQVGQGLVATEVDEVFIAESGRSVKCYFGHLSGLGALEEMSAQSCNFTGRIPGVRLWRGVCCK